MLGDFQVIELLNIVIDERARDGTWCRLPYPNHRRGCPNFGKKDKCPPRAPRFEDIVRAPYWLVAQSFDLKAHAERMKRKHPHWSERQARCVLYWQGTVNKALREWASLLWKELGDDYMVVKIPEANGVNLFATCAKIGIHLKRNPDLVWKMMIVARKNND